MIKVSSFSILTFRIWFWRLYALHHDFEGYILLIMILKVYTFNDFEGYILMIMILKVICPSLRFWKLYAFNDFEGYMLLIMILKVICPWSRFWRLYAPFYIPLIINMKKKWCIYFFVWVQTWLWFYFMTILSHMLPRWCCWSSLTWWDFAISTIFWSFTHWLPFFQATAHFFYTKKFCSKEVVEIVFKVFLASKPLVSLYSQK